jgi:hypothetical protein
MRPILLVPVLVSLGCAVPETSVVNQRDKGPQASCAASVRESAGARGTAQSCLVHPGLAEQVGNALSGTASAFRAPGP